MTISASAGAREEVLIVRADPDGDLVIANDGHPSPYSNGKEIPVGSGLPLGIPADAAIPTTYHRPPAKRLLC